MTSRNWTSGITARGLEFCCFQGSFFKSSCKFQSNLFEYLFTELYLIICSDDAKSREIHAKQNEEFRQEIEDMRKSREINQEELKSGENRRTAIQKNKPPSSKK